MNPSFTNEFRINKHWAKKSFDNAATAYDEAAVLQRQVADNLLDRLQCIKLQPDTILDIGSGTGYCARGLSKLFKRSALIHLDMALAMLAYSKKRRGLFYQCWDRWWRSQHFVCSDAEFLALKTNSVDLVFSSLAFQWSNDPDKLFQECFRVLKPGRLLMFSTLGPDTLKELRKSWARADNKTHVSPFIDMHDIGDALLRAGFSNPVMEVENMTLTYATVAKLMRDLKQIGSRNATAGRAAGLTGKKALQTMQQAYEAYRRDGRLPASYEVVYGHAWVPQEKRHSFAGNSQITIPIKQI